VTTYRLQALLDLRSAAERGARADLAEAVAGLARAAEARDGAAAALEAARARTRERARVLPPGAAPARELAARARHLERLGALEAGLAGALRARAAGVARASDRTRAAERALAAARGALRAVEGHRDRWEAGHRLARARAEASALDDLASSRAAAASPHRGASDASAFPSRQTMVTVAGR
jgi:hypothetical protein